MNNNASGGGVGFASLLTIAFIVLKLTDVITWSWVWVLSPLWISALLGLTVIGLFALGVLAVLVLGGSRKKSRR